MLELIGISKRFPGMDRPALADFSLQLDAGEIVALAGASGSGKTTALRVIGGFEEADSGTIVLEGTVLADDRQILPPEKRGIGVVFQNFALFPHLTVNQNVAFGISSRSEADVAGRVRELLSLADISELGGRYPHEISGGQQQRVALVRALAPRPHVVLLDEPFSNLDHTCTHRILGETRRIIKDSGSAAIIVTHDRYEAFTLADRIAVLSNGVVQQIGSAEEIYAHPASREVAEFSGSASFIPVWNTQGDAGRWSSPLGPVPGDVALVSGTGCRNQRLAVVRPHNLRVHANADGPTETSASAIIKDVRFLGSVLAVRMDVEWPSSHAAVDGWAAADEELLAHVGGRADELRAGVRVAVEWQDA